MQSCSGPPNPQNDDEVDPGSPIPQDDPEVEFLAELLERMHIATNYIGYHRIFRGPFMFQPSITSNAAFDSIIRPQIHPHPIFRLPPELLCEVFLHNLHEIAEKIGNDSSFYTWIRVTHVCRYWREAGLACPQLWTYLRLIESPGSMQLIDLFLARSQQALLSINMSGYPKNKWTPAVDYITRRMFKEMPRISSAQIYMPTDLLSELLSIHPITPKLQTLIIKAYDEPKLSITLLSFNPCRVLPSLKTLMVREFPFKWSTQFIHPTLTILALSGVKGTPPPQLTDMLDVLRGTPLLESLMLVGYNIVPKSPAGTAVISPIKQPVILRHLRSIKFPNVPTRDAVYLFNHITMSPYAHARFADHVGGDDNIWLIEHSINLKRSDCAIQSLSIKDTYGIYEVKCWLRHSEINILNERNPPPTFFRRVQVSKQTAFDAGHLVRGLQLSEVRTLHFEMPNFLSSSWHTVFGTMKKLKVLYLYGMVAEHLFVALGREPVRPQHDSTAPISGSSSQEKPSFLFPALDMVFLDNHFTLGGMANSEFVDKLRDIIVEGRCLRYDVLRRDRRLRCNVKLIAV